MKKQILMASLLAMSACFCACSNEEDMKAADAADLDYSSKYATSWANYSRNVAALLKTDAQTLYTEWADGFGEKFKKGQFSGSLNESIQQILDGCITIANEVGTAKIGEPYDYATAGNLTQALYAVESWYSWHSRDDYSNNIKSIANSLAGQRLGVSPAQFGVQDAAAQSLMTFCMGDDKLRPAVQQAWSQTVAAWTAIQAIPQPFRNNIVCPETVQAMAACETLTEGLRTLKSLIAEQGLEQEWQPVVANYVDAVVMPTYKELAERNAALYDKVIALGNCPTNAAFAEACETWLLAREPWETSEAFLFGPVDEMGLDPNMDSWPLDQVAIVKILTSGKYDALNWTSDDSDSAIEAAQALRGFHTLEYLLFKDGKPRRVE